MGTVCFGMYFVEMVLICGSAVCDQLGEEEDNHEIYRTCAIRYMLKYEDQFSSFIEGNLEEYCDDMEEDGTWAGHMELVALSNSLGCRIVVHQLQKPQFVIDPSTSSSRQPIHLCYIDEEHYASVKPVTEAVAQRLANMEQQTHISQKETIAMQLSGIKEIRIVRDALHDHDGDVDSAVEYLCSMEHSDALREVQPLTISPHETKGTKPPAKPKKRLTKRERKLQKRKAKRDARKVATPCSSKPEPRMVFL